jgi:tellurite methyltransferase
VGRAATDRARWNRRYRERRVSIEPANLLVEHTDRLMGGRALDLACGTGANALFLAGLGYRVEAVDVSEVALRIAQAEARRRRVVVNWIQADARRLPLVRPSYDCVVVCRFLLRPVMPVVASLLRPGGYLFYESYNVRRLVRHPQFNRKYLLGVGELPTWFESLSTVVWREVGDVATFVGRKPGQPCAEKLGDEQAQSGDCP